MRVPISPLIKTEETLQAVTDRRNAALEKIGKRVCDSQTAADIEQAMGKGGGDDDEADEDEDEDEDGEGTRLVGNGLEINATTPAGMGLGASVELGACCV